MAESGTDARLTKWPSTRMKPCDAGYPASARYETFEVSPRQPRQSRLGLPFSLASMLR